MFDRNTQKVEVHVEAPPPIDPADAARFYAECMDRARKEVMQEQVLRLGANNELTVARVVLSKSYETDKQHVRLRFAINGQPFDLHVEEDIVQADCENPVFREFAIKLMDKVLQQMIPRRNYGLSPRA